MWQKSSRCKADSPQCVEWQHLPTGDTLIRDSKNPDGPVFRFNRHEIEAFVGAVMSGEFMAEANGTAVPAALAAQG